MSEFLKQAVEDVRKAFSEAFPTDTVTLTVDQQIVRASTVSGTGAFTITMPPVKEAQGRIYNIYMVARNGTDDITVADNAGDTTAGAIGSGDITLDAADEYTTLYSDGYNWIELGSNHA